jgi:hypothetical protein
LRSLQEIQPDFVEEAKAKDGLWSQGKKRKKLYFVKCTCYEALHAVFSSL